MEEENGILIESRLASLRNSFFAATSIVCLRVLVCLDMCNHELDYSQSVIMLSQLTYALSDAFHIYPRRYSFRRSICRI